MKKYRIMLGHAVHRAVDPEDKGQFDKDADALEGTEKIIEKLDAPQERLYAEGERALLVILQAVDTGGKDGTIRHVMRGINSQGCRVTSFQEPTPQEQSHDFLWRVHREVPAKGFAESLTAPTMRTSW